MQLNMIGQTVGNYRILKLLGEGGMGAVYLAEHPGIGRKAAVKMLHPEMAQNEEVVTRFFNEARAANAIQHPGIVEVFDFGTLPSGATYIIMEFLAGESLATRIRRVGRMAIGDAVDVTCQTAEVLGAAHDRGIVHRDLKPDNLFLIPDTHVPGREMVKVLDFGIAKLGAATGGSGSVKTRTGLIMGTPVYMSPEQCRGTKEVDHRTDIYALGVILYEMVCGEPPFVSEGQGELIHMHIATPPRPPRTRNPGIPRELEDVIQKALAKQPSGRFQTMEDFQSALKGTAVARTGNSAALKGSPARAVPATKVYPAEPILRAPRGDSPAQTTFSNAASMIENPPAQRSRWPAAMALAGALAAVGAGGWWVATRGQAAFSTTSVPLVDSVEKVPVSREAVGAATLPVPTGPSAAAPKKISVAITSDPSGARVVRERDGADIGVTPFKESWPLNEGVEKLRIEMDGFKAERFVVPLDRGVDLSFGLTKITTPSPHKRKVHEGVNGAATPSTPGAPRHAPVVPNPTPRPEPIPL
jgi:serine/threonine-protein kinase